MLRQRRVVRDDRRWTRGLAFVALLATSLAQGCGGQPAEGKPSRPAPEAATAPADPSKVAGAAKPGGQARRKVDVSSRRERNKARDAAAGTQ